MYQNIIGSANTYVIRYDHSMHCRGILFPDVRRYISHERYKGFPNEATCQKSNTYFGSIPYESLGKLRTGANEAGEDGEQLVHHAACFSSRALYP